MDIFKATSNSERLLQIRDGHYIRAVALACIEGHLSLVRLLRDSSAEIENQEMITTMESLKLEHRSPAEHVVQVVLSIFMKYLEHTLMLEITEHILEGKEEHRQTTFARHPQRKENRT